MKERSKASRGGGGAVKDGEDCGTNGEGGGECVEVDDIEAGAEDWLVVIFPG